MEEDNKKERKSMKRSHNDAVRELVAFVRKRDKRLAAHQAEEAKRRMEKEEQDKLRWAVSILKSGCFVALEDVENISCKLCPAILHGTT